MRIDENTPEEKIAELLLRKATKEPYLNVVNVAMHGDFVADAKGRFVCDDVLPRFSSNEEVQRELMRRRRIASRGVQVLLHLSQAGYLGHASGSAYEATEKTWAAVELLDRGEAFSFQEPMPVDNTTTRHDSDEHRRLLEQLDPTDKDILKVLHKARGRLDTPELAHLLGRKPKNIGKNLRKLVRIDLIENLPRKGYLPTEKGLRLITPT